MNVRKFSAHSSREAWRQVREALGPDAVILSNRSINGTIEILALAPEDMSALGEPVIEKPAVSEATLGALGARRVAEQAPAAPLPPVGAPRAIEETDQASGLAGALAASREGPRQSRTTEQGNELAALMSELRSMRGMLESQLAEIAWSSQQKREPMKAALMREMLSAGFSASLARYLTQNLPAGEKDGMAWTKAILARNLSVIGNENEILEKGGVYALVGPTGVGKTTTTAKLAARCVMRHGAGKLALITTDGYRIGGYEQLRIYGKILGVMVHSVKDETDLRIALDELKNKHMVLIDTVGMGQRDKMVAEQIAMLSGSGAKVKRLLCMSATSTGETLNEVVRSYQGDGLAGCIMTKLDEAATVGNVLDVIIRHKLNLYYVANGQRVPEDLHVANQHYLVDRAFKLKRETAPYLYKDDELPLVIANAAHAMHDKSLREVSLG
ncbi:MAG TPA: flagellar biosynthesis protein FlhF [Noviherbaspirillum sp.]|nr:flagellar biosynthesis protein FlhF [Noviherbaspirillum sp.]